MGFFYVIVVLRTYGLQMLFGLVLAKLYQRVLIVKQCSQKRLEVLRLRITEIELEYNDIEWFAIDRNQKIMRFTSGLYGHVPKFVCSSTEKNDLLVEFFENLKECTDSIILQNESFGIELLNECRDISQKGIYCFDAFDGVDDSTSYTKISAPKKPIYFYELPDHIQNLIKQNFLDVDVDGIDVISVINAY